MKEYILPETFKELLKQIIMRSKFNDYNFLDIYKIIQDLDNLKEIDINKEV